MSSVVERVKLRVAGHTDFSGVEVYADALSSDLLLFPHDPLLLATAPSAATPKLLLDSKDSTFLRVIVGDGYANRFYCVATMPSLPPAAIGVSLVAQARFRNESPYLPGDSDALIVQGAAVAAASAAQAPKQGVLVSFPTLPIGANVTSVTFRFLATPRIFVAYNLFDGTATPLTSAEGAVRATDPVGSKTFHGLTSNSLILASLDPTYQLQVGEVEVSRLLDLNGALTTDVSFESQQVGMIFRPVHDAGAGLIHEADYSQPLTGGNLAFAFVLRPPGVKRIAQLMGLALVRRYEDGKITTPTKAPPFLLDQNKTGLPRDGFVHSARRHL